MVSPQPISLIGGGEHAAVVADVITQCGAWRLSGCWAPEAPLRFRWLGTDEQLEQLVGSGMPIPHLHLALASRAGSDLRRRVAARLEALGVDLPWAALRHPSAIVSATVLLEPGCFLAAGAMVNPGAVVRRHGLVNTGAIVEHDVVIGQGAHLCPGSVTGGGAVIGDWATIGMGAMIRDHVTVGAGAVVGMGAVVVRDVPEGLWVAGNPARAMKR